MSATTKIQQAAASGQRRGGFKKKAKKHPKGGGRNLKFLKNRKRQPLQPPAVAGTTGVDGAAHPYPHLPLIPNGPSGLVYLITGVGPQGSVCGEGIVEVFEREQVEPIVDPWLAESLGWPERKIRPFCLERGAARRVEGPLDREILALLLRTPRLRTLVTPKKSTNGRRPPLSIPERIKYALRASPTNGSGSTLAAFLVNEDAWKKLLPLLFESGRAYLDARPGLEPARLEREEQLPPFEFRLSIEFGHRNGEYHLAGRFLRDGKMLPIEAHVILISDGEKGHLLRASGRLSDVDFKGSAAWLRALRRGRFQRVSKRSIPKLLKVFERSTTLPPLMAPATLGISLIEGELPRPELKLESGPQEVIGEVNFRYGEEDVVRAARPGRCFFSTRTQHAVVRDLDAEARHAVRLLDLGFGYDHATHNFHLSADKLPNAAPELFEYGWTITGKGMPFRPPSDMEVDINSTEEWIELSVRVHFGERVVELPALLGAIHEGNRMIPLGRGEIGVLPFEWLEKNAAWMALGEVHGDKLRFRRNQSPVVDALLSENIKSRLDDGFRAERERLAGFKGIEPLKPAKEFHGTLRAYQELGLGWLRFLDQMAWGGCLADDMGLGKTVQALALLQLLKDQGRSGTTLIVAPKSLIFNWLRETKRFTPDLTTLAYVGPKRAGYLERLGQYDLVFTTYGTVRRDVEKLAKFEFFYVILDEGQAIKNPDSQNARASLLLKGERRLILSGTPIENHLGELWSLFHFLNPGMLGSAASFKKRFGSGIDADSASLKMLRKTLRPFILRRKKEEVALDLPEKIEETILCEMEPEQKKLYKKVKIQCRNSIMARIERSGVARSKLHILEALLRLRQAACHPGLIDEEMAHMPSGKFQVLLSMLDQVLDEGHKVLIFSQFTSLLAILRRDLDGQGKVYEYLDGQTENRQVHVDRFQTDPECPIFLISLKAGGVGLNLTAADYVFILDPWWNPAVETQAIDRAHRIGQDKKVFAYRFVSEDSIEERITELQESKRKLADAIVAGSDSFLRDLTREQLEFLFR